MCDCIEFQGALNNRGYGMKWRDGKTHLAHRLAYADAHGLAPSDVPPLLRHKCDNPRCVNAEHLEPGTQTDNMQDAAKRHRCGKLTAAQVTEIRSLYVKGSKEFCQSALGKRFGVRQTTISNTVNNKSFKELRDGFVT